MIDIVWLGPVFLIPGIGSLPFCCRLLLALQATVFMWLGALTVSLQFVGSMDNYGLALSPSSLAFPVLPRDSLFRFAHCSLVGYRLFQTFAFLSYLVTC